jgi:hypothetical protein
MRKVSYVVVIELMDWSSDVGRYGTISPVERRVKVNKTNPENTTSHRF